MMTPSFKEPLKVLLGALLAVGICEVAAQRVAPIPPRIVQVDDGVRAYATSDPDTLVLGSSHTRSFAPLRDMVAARTHGAQHMTLVPVEWGTFGSYRWVLDNRLRPLIEARDARTGRLQRGRLSRAVLVTTFYDLCRRPGLSESNLPARAWTFRHFAADVAARGLDDFNSNYLQTALADLLPFSDLLQDRGYGRITTSLIDRARGLTEAERAERERSAVEVARGRMEEQYDYCDDAQHKRSLRAMIDYFRGRGVEVAVVLFPLMPDIVSQRSRDTTLRRYDAWVASLAREVPVRVADMTLRAPLGYEDFQPDLDHLTLAGNVKFSRWALAHEMSWLLDAPARGEAP